MGLLGNLFGNFLTDSSDSICDDDTAINPANGMPMIDGSCGVDIEGNMYGTDSNHEDMFTDSLSSFDDNDF